MTSDVSEIAGAAAHARALLEGTGEPLLWAAFSTQTDFDVPGVDREGRPRQAVLRAAEAAATVYLDDEHRPPPHVLVFGREPGCLAMRHGDGLAERHPWLWALTPTGLRRARRERPPRADAESTGLLGGLAGFGRDVGSAFGSRAERRTLVHPLTPVAEIPRERIGLFSVGSGRFTALRSRPCLRLELVDGSGYELYFSHAAEEPRLYERLLALTHGAPERRP